MTRKPKPDFPRRAILEPPSAESLGLTDLAPEADEDAGISLEELGQTYAALLAKGADPYPEDGEIATSEESELDAALASVAPEESDNEERETASVPAAVPGQNQLRRVVDGDDDRGCEITPRTILEAILFVGHPQSEPLSSQQIAGLMRGVTGDEVDELVRELNEAYSAEYAPYVIQSRGPGYLLELREEFSPLRDNFYGRIKEVRLTQGAIDVLAIVAYNQPITLQEIDRIRGRSSGAAISQLVRRDILAYEKSEEKGAKPTYRTTERFLDLYGLESLDDLPQVDRPL
ncbi:MAG: SMC-Scp complex subunit ScpB [Planctomycetales bacterium]|nr:SMC-Scp complex subunit ScpB [Planctomycetales bacterium]